MNYHKATEHSYKSVRMNSGFLDWSTQPCAFKIYPKFYPRFKLDATRAIDNAILLAGKITFEKRYGNDVYFLRAWPSAGALYPVEMYLQMRYVDGFVDGIYHFEPQSETLVLLHELNGDGLERIANFEYDIKGALFLFASPYFRSSWKYKNRAFRYCLLDSGHHYGALEFGAYVSSCEAKAIFCFDKVAVSAAMGFENKELPTLMAFIGETSEPKSVAMSEALPFVPSTDYFEQNELIEEAYKDSLSCSCGNEKITPIKGEIDRGILAAVIEERRSIRAFFGKSISAVEYESIVVMAGFDSRLDVFVAVNNIDGLQKGIYKNGELVKAGDFSQKVGYLCLEQALASRSAATIFIAGSGEDYCAEMIAAGIYGHRVYIGAGMQGVGVSGIGAYYDGEVKEFLGTDKYILYAVAVGR